MNHSLLPLSESQQRQSLLTLNRETSRHGLTLSPSDAAQLVVFHAQTLRDTGRVVFEGGCIERLILAFCDSPYIQQTDYRETLCELIELFYHLKNQTLDRFSDEDILMRMRKCFDDSCQGSIERLTDLLWGGLS